ncbi:hypothetical protein GTR02_19085 [Kineococcus sp. R8]|uniref:hypothetical protein n=1 Tax=Kineococcus siccus TaxID=2696567 RepID=UPI0014123371|nr:hypothetical protein [Kineococcus siccus]NAZ83920.1 hypothetical protein [Kineococcus siccus]
MSTFGVPPGDPAGLRSVVDRLSQLSGTLGETRGSRLRTLAEQAEGALPAARVAAFAGARGQATTATSALGSSLVAIGGALADYADALETSQHEIRGASERYDAAQARCRTADTAGDVAGAETARLQMSQETATVSTLGSGLSQARQRAATALRAEVDAWVPDAGALSPVQAWEQAATGLLPPGAGLDAETLRDAYANPDVELARKALGEAKTLALKGYQLTTVLGYARSGVLAQRAEQRLLTAVSAYQALKGAAPDLADPAQYRAYLAAEREALAAWSASRAAPTDLSRAQTLYKLMRGYQGEAGALATAARQYPSVAADAIRTTGRLDGLMRPVRAAAPVLAKVMGPVSVLLGGYDMYTAVTDDEMATDDRVARFTGGAASVVGGVATTALAFGLMTGPVGVGVVAAAGVVAVGCWVYENREAIAEGAGRAASAVGNAAKSVWKGLFG